MIDKTFIIAEVANAHSGCPEAAIKIGEAGIEAGVRHHKVSSVFCR